MFTIEQDSGTYTGSLRRHNGYYAGDFTHNPTRTDSEISELPASPPSRSTPGMAADLHLASVQPRTIR